MGAGSWTNRGKIVSLYRDGHQSTDRVGFVANSSVNKVIKKKARTCQSPICKRPNLWC